MKYKCSVCGFVHDEEKENLAWEKLPENWLCPICGVGKELFAVEEAKSVLVETVKIVEDGRARTASDVIIETLRDFGVRRVFGMVGHSNLGLGDAIRRCVERGEMNFVGIRHEGAAAFAASAYGKLTGTPAACLTIAGPGATNLITGLADASLDHAPVIALTGQVPSSTMGLYAFQELDLTLALKAVAQTQITVMRDSNFAALTSAACRNAIFTKSVSQLILPDDVQNVPVPEDASVGTPAGSVFSDFSPSASEAELAAVATIISRARKPFVIIGEGCRHAIDAALDFAKTLNAAVVTTYRAKGFVSDTHPLACGVVGRSGTTVSAKMMAESDCIIGLGVGFSNHSEIAKNKLTIQFDKNPHAVGRLRKVDACVLGDLSKTLPAMIQRLSGNCSVEDPRERIALLWKEWREEKCRRAERSRVGKIAPAAACTALTNCIAEDAVISVDVGNVAYAFGRYFEAKNQRVLLSFYLGSIGVGLPAAMGAWCATQDDLSLGKRQVVAVVGDGGLGQYLAEWTTVVHSGMDIKCVVFNNSELAKISLEQRNAHVNVWETTLRNPDFSEFAKLCGSAAVRISDPAILNEELAKAFAIPGPVLIEILTDPDAA